MGRNLSPALSQELANLGKDADSRKTAMKALKLYLKDLDSKAIPLFLAKVSETKNAGSSYGEYTISLYEVLARVHGPKIVSQLENIMSTIIKTLTTSGGSFPLQQACSKVVPAIARYGIEPTTPEEKKRHVIHSLCKPLCNALLSKQESLSCGAALCLKALVDSDNWRFASDEMVNEVCLKLSGALKDTSTQTNSHMGLVMSLAKRNSFLVEAYARLLVKAGLHILTCGLAERNSQKRLTAIQMVHSLMKCLDIRSIFSELDVIIEEMEKCESDQLPFVKGAAFEALQTAKKLQAEKGSKITDSDVMSESGSNFSRRRNLSTSPLSGSPESQTLDSYATYNESNTVSPMSSTCQVSCNVDRNRKNLTRKLWRENGCVNGIFSELNSGGSKSRASSDHDDKSCNGFQGLVAGNPVNGGLRSRTPSPQRTKCHLNVESIKMFTTPRKLVHSLQNDDVNSDYFDDNVRGRWSPVKMYDACGCLHMSKSDGREICTSDAESVSSTEDLTGTNVVSHEKFRGGEKHSPQVVIISKWKITYMFLFIVLVIFAAFVSVLFTGNQERCHNLVPT
ncbi:hypothetical protein RND81_14G060400 [Saponaria officinalis]|uniref:TORTIFOLIA1/SINE1-2 N-terminal domain-containing protein n=1 Tax=Saponaria officinalis TaxID=3572 RepID=A0AAW1GT35_SAPOF